MATNFPTNIDTFTEQTSSDLITSAKWNNLQDSIEALEVKVGADNSTVTTSHDYKIAELATTLGAITSAADVADLEKLHAITSTHTEINQLHESGVVKADLVKLHAITASAVNINALTGATSTPGAGKAAIRDANAVVKGAELSMTGDAADEASAYEVTLDLGSVKEGDVVFLQGYSRVGWSSAPTSINLSIGYKSGTSYLKYFNEETTPSPLQYLTAPIIPTGTASTGAISGIGTVDQDGTLVVRAFVSRSGGTSLTYQTKIRAFFLKKQ